MSPDPRFMENEVESENFPFQQQTKMRMNNKRDFLESCRCDEEKAGEWGQYPAKVINHVVPMTYKG